jgi:hypothetical protein
MPKKVRAAAFALVGIAIVCPEPTRAGFFDELFGGAEVQERREAAPEPFQVIVRPSRRLKPSRQPAPRLARPKATKPARIVQKSRPREIAIDPQKDPQWFLHDPTLRTGDVVVLPDRVMVYAAKSARPPRTERDFVSLNRSRLPARMRQLIERLAAAPSRIRTQDSTSEMAVSTARN